MPTVSGICIKGDGKLEKKNPFLWYQAETSLWELNGCDRGFRSVVSGVSGAVCWARLAVLGSVCHFPTSDHCFSCWSC